MTEDALQRLVNAVERHYEASNPMPLLMSSFGQRNKVLLAELKDSFGSLKNAVNAAGAERIQFVDNTVGREAIAPAKIADELRHQVQVETIDQREAADKFDRLPTPVKIAFCVRTETGEHVAIDTARPFRFTKVTSPELIRPTQRIIPEAFRRPGLLLRNASIHDREALWRQFLKWADEVNLDPTIFDGPTTPLQSEATTALTRLISAQPAEIISRLVIPGDIAQILLKHS